MLFRNDATLAGTSSGTPPTTTPVQFGPIMQVIPRLLPNANRLLAICQVGSPPKRFVRPGRFLGAVSF
jgi:hypothetical protein